MAFKDLNESPGKAGQALTVQRVAHEHPQPHRHPRRHLRVRPARVLRPGSSIRRRTAPRRPRLRWTDTLAPLSIALHLLLGLLRESGVPHKVVANGGQYQQSLPTARTYHLLRVKLPLEADLVPEISGHRLMVSIRPDEGRRRRPAAAATPKTAAFELALCA